MTRRSWLYGGAGGPQHGPGGVTGLRLGLEGSRTHWHRQCHMLGRGWVA